MGTADRYHKVLTITWGQLHHDAKMLTRNLLSLRPFTGIVAITRGGLIPAAIIARELDIRLVDTVCIATYQGRSQSTGLEVLKSVDGDGDGWLIVDDLVDTGRTARAIRDMLPKAHFATLYAKPEGRALVDSCIAEFSQDTWVLFPWDSEIQYATPLVEQQS